MKPELFTRDGHLLDVALDLLEIGDLSAESEAGARAHLADCPPCTERAGDVARLHAAPLPPLELPAAPAARPLAPVIPLRPWRAWGAGALLAAAAAALLFVLPDGSDEFQPRGGGQLSLQVFRHDGAASAPVTDGDAVTAGERLGFRVEAGRAGHLLIVGVDGAGNTYPCHPASEVAAGMHALESAVRLDATPGQERIAALLCDDPITMDSASATLRAAAGGPLTLRGDCVADEVRLTRAAVEKGTVEPAP